jgi:hypothetical protein
MPEAGITLAQHARHPIKRLALTARTAGGGTRLVKRAAEHTTGFMLCGGLVPFRRSVKVSVNRIHRMCSMRSCVDDISETVRVHAQRRNTRARIQKV